MSIHSKNSKWGGIEAVPRSVAAGVTMSEAKRLVAWGVRKGLLCYPGVVVEKPSLVVLSDPSPDSSDSSEESEP